MKEVIRGVGAHLHSRERGSPLVFGGLVFGGLVLGGRRAMVIGRCHHRLVR